MTEVGGFRIPWLLVPVLFATGALMWFLARAAPTRRSVASLALLPLLAGLALGIRTLHEPSGYVAAYWFGTAWFFSVGLAVVGALMVIVKRLRRGGFFSLCSSALLLTGFYSAILLGRAFGLTRWSGADG